MTLILAVWHSVTQARFSRSTAIPTQPVTPAKPPINPSSCPFWSKMWMRSPVAVTIEDSTRGVRRQATGVELVSHVTPAVPGSNTPTPVHDQHDSGLAVGGTQVGVLVLLHKQSQIPGGEDRLSLLVVLYILSKTSAEIPADFLLGIFPV